MIHQYKKIYIPKKVDKAKTKYSYSHHCFLGGLILQHLVIFLFFLINGCHLVDALERIVRTMGATYWKFDEASCQIEKVGLTSQPPRGSEQSIICQNFLEKNSTVLHVVSMYLPYLIKYFNQFCNNHVILYPGSWALVYEVFIIPQKVLFRACLIFVLNLLWK